jgi:hypothetical protein
VKRPEINLNLIVSDGPRVVDLGDGATDTHASPCAACGGAIVPGDRISKVFRQWQHDACSVDSIAALPARKAWLALALDAARSPRRYGVAALKTILKATVEIAQGAWAEEDDAYVEALKYAYELRIADALGESVGTNDPETFASRWAAFDWSDPDTEERLPLPVAYGAMWAESTTTDPASLVAVDGAQ